MAFVISEQIALNRAVGSGKKAVINSTAVTTGKWYGILIINDSYFTTLGDNSVNSGAHNSGTLYPAGMFLPGDFETIQLTSGVVWAFEK